MFNDKVVFITGGTGTLGQALTKYIVNNYAPKKVIIYSRDEYKQSEMKKRLGDELIRYIIGDVRDQQSLERAMQDVDYVIHTAAMKHVDIAEYNPIEVIKTNVDGAMNVILASINTGVKKVVALSTDKASSPITLYGATKFVSDRLFQAAKIYKKNYDIQMSVVRYGNVSNSRGSIIPYFNKLTQSGQRILPLTHEDMTRFLITIDQAIDLIVTALARGESGDIFVAKTKSIKILDLIAAYNCNYNITGIRECEKLHEELISEHESYDEFKNYYKISNKGSSRGHNYRSDKNQFMTIDEIKAIIKGGV